MCGACCLCDGSADMCVVRDSIGCCRTGVKWGVNTGCVGF